MATTRPKLWLSTSKIRIINVVTLLMLSAVAVADEGNSTRQCYWCGPIAEQVQRSDVAPPCGPKNTVVFDCQEGYNYCAIAASSPPYMVSRFCSKVYQDECYPQYCNSTKVWRMTCTCRGDLCNENITQRETEAFASLPREPESKDARGKRDTKNGNFVLSDSEKTVIITNLSTVPSDVKAMTTEIDHVKIEDDDQKTELVVSQPKVPVQIVTKDDDIVANDTVESESVELEDNNADDLTKEDKIKVDHNNKITSTSVKDIMLTKIVVGSTKITKVNEAPVITNTVRPSEKLPTAEALQQEASSENDETNTEHTTVDEDATPSGTSVDDNDDDDNNDNHHNTTEPGDADESSANENSTNMLLLANGLLLHFVYNRK